MYQTPVTGTEKSSLRDRTGEQNPWVAAVRLQLEALGAVDETNYQAGARVARIEHGPARAATYQTHLEMTFLRMCSSIESLGTDVVRYRARMALSYLLGYAENSDQ